MQNYHAYATLCSVVVGVFSWATSVAQPYEKGWIDTVVAFRPGPGQAFGREYFPENIFGPPDSAARPNRPSANPRQILSLGFGGEIVVGFRGRLLLNGPGPDFVVFENAFITPAGRVFIEPACVSVSSDGVSWVAFPWDTLTLTGCAGRTPTDGRTAADLEPSHGGGDWFSLELLGVDTVRYIRITDLTGWLAQHPEHPQWDPTLSGFDLDAVGARYLVPETSRNSPEQLSRKYILDEPCVLSAALQLPVGSSYRLFTLHGCQIAAGTLGEWFCLPYHGVPLVLQVSDLPDTVWLLVWV
jgi:hypothetical protein